MSVADEIVALTLVGLARWMGTKPSCVSGVVGDAIPLV